MRFSLLPDAAVTFKIVRAAAGLLNQLICWAVRSWQIYKDI